MTDSPRPAVLDLDNVVKHYPGVRAVDGVSMSLRAGEVVGLVGKNGAGKSTLIKIMAGAVRPDSGTITRDGQPLDLSTPLAASRAGLAFVHQDLHDVADLSVAENVMLGLGFPSRFGLVDWKALRRKATEALQRLDVDIDPKAAVGDLSVARKRMVMIAHGLAKQARLLVLDEPSASLTDEEIEHLFSVVRRLRDEGIGVVYVTHRLEEIFELTGRVIVMRNGVTVADEPTAALNRTQLIAHITGHDHAQTAVERRRAHGIGGRPDTPVLLNVHDMTTLTGVEGCSFEVREGEVLGLAGLVGAGRTELVRAVFGADRRVSGAVEVRGRAVDTTSPEKAMKAGLALLPEDRKSQGNIMDFSVRQNVTLASMEHHRIAPRVFVPRPTSERTSALAMIERLGISTPDDRKEVRLLSGGNQQKVVIAKWLAHGADVLVFDEPTHGVDVDGKEEIYDIMGELAAEGKGVIFISSEFSELVGACHRVIVLHEGRIIGELSGDAITEPAIVELCYAG